MATLFNMPTPEEVRQEARQSTLRQNAALFGQNAVQGAAVAAGGLFGEGLARSMGGVLPQEERARKFQILREEVMKEFGDMNATMDENDYLRLTQLTAQKAAQMGLADVAEQAMAQGMQIKSSLSKKRDTEIIKGESGIIEYTPGQGVISITDYPEGFKPLGAGKTEEQVKLEQENKKDLLKLKDEQSRQLAELESKLTRQKGLDKAYTDMADQGIGAAESYSTLARANELLKSDFGTSGIQQTLLKAKQYFGIDAADETDLYNKLGVAVAQQLRPTFGAQFTKAEGDWMQSFSAGFGKSKESNKRLVEEGLKLAKLRADRGLAAAKAMGEFGTVHAESINNALKLKLYESEKQVEEQKSTIMKDPKTGKRYVVENGKVVREL